MRVWPHLWKPESSPRFVSMFKLAQNSQRDQQKRGSKMNRKQLVGAHTERYLDGRMKVRPTGLHVENLH